MTAGFFDLLAWLLGWKSSDHALWQTIGPYYVDAAAAQTTGATAADIESAGATAGMVFGSNVERGWCHG